MGSPKDNIDIPRNEYPRPQFVRDKWLCLNGKWEFEIDHADTGLERGLLGRSLRGSIVVPFCPESKLSGIEYVDFMNAVWYRREVVIPESWTGLNILLHFQAVDYDTTVWVNGEEMVRHRGCWCGFSCDITEVAKAGDKIVIVVRARDLKSETIKPSGKQVFGQYANNRCYFTRTTGIWQTVWLEPVSQIHLNRPRITPDVANSRFLIDIPITNSRADTKVRVVLSDEEGDIIEKCVCSDFDFTPAVNLNIPENRLRYWSNHDPFLYGIKIELLDSLNNILDSVNSYAGLRSITIDDKAVKINGKVVFQRLVLDQGYYPEGIMTAPTDTALKKDIELAMQLGFNGARLHQKVFEERFLYYCDKMGYLVWSEFGDWGINTDNPQSTYITQWLEVLNRDYNHPSIIGWCGLNETRKEITDENDYLNDLTLGMFLAAKSMDKTRPVIDASGHSHRVSETDIYDGHLYEQDPVKFKNVLSGLAKGKPFTDYYQKSEEVCSVQYKGQPYFCSEFGGIKWHPEKMHLNCDRLSWGYGEGPRTPEEFYRRFEDLCNVLLEDENMFGYCYTQLTDVFQERNGLLYFDRSQKFDFELIKQVQKKVAAIEKKFGSTPKKLVDFQAAKACFTFNAKYSES